MLEVLGKLNFNCLWSAKIGSQRQFGALFGLLGLLGIQYLSDHSFLLCDSDNNTKIQPKTLPKAWQKCNEPCAGPGEPKGKMCWKNRRARAENYEKYPLKLQAFSWPPQMQIHEKTKAKPTLLLSLKKAQTGATVPNGNGNGYSNGHGAGNSGNGYIAARDLWSGGVRRTADGSVE